MQRFIRITFLATLCFSLFPLSAHALEKKAHEKLAGLFLIQTQSYGRAWYVSPFDGTRYYIKDKESAYGILRQLSVTTAEKKGSLIQTAGQGMLWTNPRNGTRYEIHNGEQAMEVIKKAGVGVKDSLLASIPINSKQIIPDTAFGAVAFAKYDGSQVTDAQYGNTILPLASLTKLMTAMVILDTNPVWDARITIQKSHIDYPKRFVGDDQTSEVSLKEGMQLTKEDLWKAMLVASSNQAAVALADNSGLSLEEFVARMNAKAASLGLSKTRFYDCAGLDAHNVSTARETALLAAAAFQYPRIREGTHADAFSLTAYSLDGKKKFIAVTNRNYSLLTFAPDASKTGFLVEAQRNVALLKNGATIVVLHARSMRERNSIIQKLL